jgi:hypothetical protein
MDVLGISPVWYDAGRIPSSELPLGGGLGQDVVCGRQIVPESDVGSMDDNR